MSPFDIIGWAIALMFLALGAAVIVACVRYTIDEWKGRHPRGTVVMNLPGEPERESLWGVLDEPTETK